MKFDCGRFIVGCAALLAGIFLVNDASWFWVCCLFTMFFVGICLMFAEGNKPTRRRKRIDQHIRNKRRYGWKKAYEILKQ